MLEVLLGLRRDIPHSSFSLEFDDELPGCVHPATIGQSAAVEEGMLCKPQPLAYTASFSSLAGRNAIFLLALILMASPIAGFRPYVTALFRTWRMPRPFRRILSPLVVSVTKSPRAGREERKP